MIVPTDRIAPVLFASLPSLTLVAGIGATATSAAPIAPPDGRIVFALVMAAVAPIAAMTVLGIVAPRVDFVLVAVVGMLVAIGLSALYRLSLAPGIDGAFYSAIVTRHALFVAAGFLALAAGALAERGIDRARRYP